MSKRAPAWNNNLLWFLFTIAVVFSSRLPFLLPGYGTDPDAWGVVFAARQIWNTGSYYISRFPGNPVQEFFYSTIWWGGPILLNGITALLSGIASAFMVLIIKKLDGQQPFLTGMIFAFIPVVFINSVNSIDYVWAIACILGSLYFLLDNKTLLSGLFLGLAIGTRITSGAMLLPLGILWIVKNNDEKQHRLVQFITVSLTVSGICFLPGYLMYGFGIFHFPDNSDISLLTVVKLATVDIWGPLGFIVLIIALGCMFFRILSSEYLKVKIGNYSWIWILTMVLYIVSFIRLPHESGYLIPVLPFGVFLLNKFMDRKTFLLMGIGIILSPFLFSISHSTYNNHHYIQAFSVEVNYFKREKMFIYPIFGPVFEDHLLRSSEINRFENIIGFGNSLQQKSLIVVGWNISKFAVLGLTENHNPTLVQYSDFLTQSEIQYFYDNGYKIYYLAEILKTSKEIYGVDFQQFEGCPLA